jgi:dipeptidyl aminopeptidase/acylaminoacyl peptidase
MKFFLGSDNNWDLAKMYSSELNVTAQTPPAFLLLTDNDDVVIPKHSIEFYLALKKYNIPAEMHIFQEGGHGFGITKKNLPVNQWPDLFLQWLKAINVLK